MKMQRWPMGLYHQFQRNMRDKRGSSSLLFGLLFLIPLFIFSVWLIESKYLYTTKAIADDAVVAAGLAALKSANPYDAAYGEYHLDPSAARNTFNQYLKANMKLDDGYRPLHGSVAAGTVRIDEFIVYNPGDYPTVCPRGVPINRTSIHVVVRFQVKRPALRGLFGSLTNMTIHRDLDNFYVLEEE
ncbi:hypothetical protein [Tepidanaerobacter acetatoxydans]|uniref:hypothetical protein n=1 Tax=Tepidanaerobacter acetatoxydans TaxID=499229 RepID=UPI00235B6FEF|nr:hypothetical protein [Tepidanaerobacter acetatoxydans]